MKINKMFLVAGIAALGLAVTSCSDDDEYTPGQPSTATENVSFVDEENYVLKVEDSEFQFTLVRESTNGALTVPLEKIQVPDFVSIPDQVTFADGEDEVTVTAIIGEDMEIFKSYFVVLKVPDTLAKFYDDETDYSNPRLNITILKEDYEPYAVGVYQDPIFYQAAWEQVIEYSALRDTYRMKGVFKDGTDWFFHWNRKYGEDSQEFYWTDETGNAVTSFFSGYTHSRYGNVTVNDLYGTSADYPFIGYDAEENAFYWPISFDVSAGSFGAGYEGVINVQFIGPAPTE